MAFTTALQGRQPIIDLASIDAKAQRYRNNELDMARKSMSNNVFDAQAANDINHEQALGDYRAKKSAGQDGEAMAALDAYPEDQRKLYDAFDGMSPEDFEGARSRARAFGAAAQFVSQFPDGSPQRVDAWRKSIDKLLQDGHLDEDSAQKLIETGPNDLIIDQALTIDQYTQKYAGPKGEKDRAAADLTKRRIDDIGQDNELARYKADAQVSQGDRRVSAAEERAKRPAAAKTGGKDPDVVKREHGLRMEKGINDLLSKKRKELGLEDEDMTAPDTGKSDQGATLEDIAAQEGLAAKKQKYRDYEAQVRKNYEPKGANPDGKGGMYNDPNAAPPPMKDRVIGKVYPSRKGPVVWTGEYWEPAGNG